jgi:transposase-like protein
MPYDEWYDDDTREAATARVLERRATKPGDRNVLTVVADEFGIPQQTLRAWVEEAAPEPEKPARKPRPKFSQVVTTRIEPAPVPAPEVMPDADVEPDEEHQAEPEPEPEADADAEAEADREAGPDVETQPAPPAPTPVAARAPVPHTDEIAALEAEVVALRAGNRVLTEAMRVLLDP